MKNDIGPLMQWVNIRGSIEAYQFDHLIINTQIALLKESAAFEDLRDRLLEGLDRMQMNLNPVRAKASFIVEIKTEEFWSDISFAELEKVRTELRNIWKYREKDTRSKIDPKIIDVTDGGEEFKARPTNLRSVDMMAYRKRVEEALIEIFDTNETLQKIKRGESVSESDLNALCSLVLTQNPNVDLHILKDFYGEAAVSLDFIIRSIIGLDTEIVKQRFSEFEQAHPQLTADQTRFINLLQNHISRFGSIEIDRLYEPPFTTIDSDGPDGVFPNEKDVDDLIEVLETFQPTDYGDARV
ncbi:MAG: hypothetical protein JRD68_15110 [Deltaproteobacteria bacterium]|nr:hypothetical protein [Deltaproteobacteria bacterium]